MASVFHQWSVFIMAFTYSDELMVAKQAARQAGDFLREHLGSVRVQEVTYKGDIDIVTPYDLEAQRLVVQSIKAAFPEHSFLTEESQGKTGGSSSTSRWIIDPLDGTTNYARGFPYFCVSLALEVSGQVELGVVYAPMLNELFYATRGGGAFMDDMPLHASATPRLKEAVVATGFPYDNGATLQECLRLLARITRTVRTSRCAGAAALDICYVACGRLDAYWDIEMWPWDIAAGALIVSEASGRVTGVKGQPFDHLGRTILASNGALHAAILETLWSNGASSY
jgi:myo-inositol-1(or 4)-monophosphatase